MSVWTSEVEWSPSIVDTKNALLFADNKELWNEHREHGKTLKKTMCALKFYVVKT